MERIKWVLVISLMFAATAKCGNVDTIRTNILQFLTAANVNQNDSALSASLTMIKDSAQKYVNTCQANGSWNDINYTVSPGAEWSLATHVHRLHILALAYASPGQSLYHSCKNGAAHV